MSSLYHKSPPQDQLAFLEMKGFRWMGTAVLLPTSRYPASLAQVGWGALAAPSMARRNLREDREPEQGKGLLGATQTFM